MESVDRGDGSEAAGEGATGKATRARVPSATVVSKDPLI
jgi:hypothetical protein